MGKASFHRLSQSEASDFLADKGQAKRRPHAMTEKVCHWFYCKYCGLVGLKNEVSRRAVKEVCVTYE